MNESHTYHIAPANVPGSAGMSGHDTRVTVAINLAIMKPSIPTVIQAATTACYPRLRDAERDVGEQEGRDFGEHRRGRHSGHGRATLLEQAAIGTTNFNLMVDTGSANTWVGSSNYSICKAPGPTGAPCKLPGTLSVLKLLSRLIGASDRIISDVFGPDLDGILGLGPREATSDPLNPNSPYYDPILTSLIKTCAIPANSFSLVLSGAADITTRDGGCLTFGGRPNFIKVTSPWATTPFLTSVLSTHGIPSASINSPFLPPRKPQSHPSRKHGTLAIMDSGTLLTRLIPPAVQALYNLMPGTHISSCSNRNPKANAKCTDDTGVWDLPCTGALPRFSITLGGMEWNGPPLVEVKTLDDGNGRSTDPIPLVFNEIAKSEATFHEQLRPVCLPVYPALFCRSMWAV
ncbi:aspartic peptidase domain-containing protein [Immersiella caudata]|uniref:Aspartic peptidase domain-containing protein n=1 Tax=Immersiella caudata TaxID=314043 RepID=A0AA39WG34_9PEZI|nr:aspartic peptidase domain-containing protein [Immersiella caudata]